MYLGALDRSSGALAAGTPTVDDRVLTLANAGSSTYVGGSFGRFTQSPTAFLARTAGAGGAPPAVTVVRANGGEYLAIGSTYHFEYTASDASGIASVDLELSRAGGGGPWTTIAAGVPNTGELDWVVTGPAAAGTAFLRVTARGFGGAVTSDLSNLSFTIGTPVAGVETGSARALSLALGPNPARAATDLRFTLPEPARVRVRLVDVQGRVAWSSPERSFDAGAHVVPCALDGVAPGLYFVRVERGRESAAARLVVIQ
jgi:hypothetical protein